MHHLTGRSVTIRAHGPRAGSQCVLREIVRTKNLETGIPTMNTSVRTAALLVAGVVVAGAGPHPAWAGKPSGGGSSGGYTLVTLDNRPELAFSWLNDVREVSGSFLCVGNLDGVGGEQAVVWQVTPNGSTYTVTTHYLADGQFADAINAEGEVVGHRSDIDAVFDPENVLWLDTGLYWPDRMSSPLSLSPLDGDNGTQAAGINAAGVIVGRSSKKWATYNPAPPPGQPKLTVFEEVTAVAWRVVGTEIQGPFVLGPPSPPVEGAAYGINECDTDGVAQVVGNTTAGPVLWEVDCLSPTLASTGPVQLVPPSKTSHGAALAINDAGDACGHNTALAFRSLAGGVFQELSTPRGASSKALDINDSRRIVGQVIDPAKGTFAALWQADGSRIDLNSFLGRTSDWERIWWGTSITANGAIGAIGAKKGTAGNESRALLMIAK